MAGSPDAQGFLCKAKLKVKEGRLSTNTAPSAKSKDKRAVPLCLHGGQGSRQSSDCGTSAQNSFSRCASVVAAARPAAISLSACSRVRWPVALKPASTCHERNAPRVRCPKTPSAAPTSLPNDARPRWTRTRSERSSLNALSVCGSLTIASATAILLSADAAEGGGDPIGHRVLMVNAILLNADARFPASSTSTAGLSRSVIVFLATFVIFLAVSHSPVFAILAAMSCNAHTRRNGLLIPCAISRAVATFPASACATAIWSSMFSRRL